MIEKNFNATLTFQLSDSGLGERIGDTDSYDGLSKIELKYYLQKSIMYRSKTKVSKRNGKNINDI